jgi:vancomycin resistance protein YoaR
VIRLRSLTIVFLAILLQSLLAISGGFLVLHLINNSHISENVYINDLHIGGLDREAAAKKIDEYFYPIIQNTSLTVKYNESDEFKIRYSDIDAFLDTKATVNAAFRVKSWRHLLKFAGIPVHINDHSVPPVVKYNSSKLKENLKSLAALIDRAPVNANLRVNEGLIEKVSEQTGIRLKIDNAIEILSPFIRSLSYRPVELTSMNSYIIETIYPKITMSDLKDIEEIISVYSTEILSSKAEESIQFAAKAINGVIVSPSGKKNSSGKDELFSFNSCLASFGEISDNDIEGYSQVASTLYVALLGTGIEKGAVTRVPHKIPTGYIAPGLDVKVNGSSYDLKFINAFDHKIAIFAEVKDNKLYVGIGGKKRENKDTSVITTDIVQKYRPTVIYVEDSGLKPGETRQISAGIEGMKVNIYRDGVLLYSDIYDAVMSTVHVGPKTGWRSSGSK